MPIEQPEHRHALWLILGVAVFPFVYEHLYRLIAARGDTRRKADS